MVASPESPIVSRIASRIREVPDFPSEGVLFRDITTLLCDAAAFKETIDYWASQVPHDVDLVIGTEARGFMLGAPLSYVLGVGFVPARKSGKLPMASARVAYDLEYGSAEIELSKDTVSPGDRVLVVDDLLATGGTARATCELVEEAGGVVAGATFLIELVDLGGRGELEGYPITSVLAL